MKPLLMPLIVIAMLAGCQTLDETPGGRLGQATLRFAGGAPAGTARLFGSGTEATLSVSLSGMPGGGPSVHLHTIGSCDPPDFASAGAPLGLLAGQHAFEPLHNPLLPHVPAPMGASGAGTVSAILDGTPEAVIPRIFDADGSAIIVHAAGHDDQTDAAADPAERFACGILLQG
jgi:Cu-Zn family superoxide dismutase